MKKRIVNVLLFALLYFCSEAQKTAILCKTLIDGTGKTITSPAIMVENGKITSIGKRTDVGPGTTIIDLGDYTMLPGLIDAHTHPCNNSSDDYQITHLRNSSAAKALIGLKNVQDLLAAGWTCLRVAGDADVGYADLGS